MAHTSKPAMNKKKKKYEDWEIEGFARTLVEAREIEADEHLMAYVQPVLEKQQEAVMATVFEVKKGK